MPELFAIHSEKDIYLIEDLGDEALYNRVQVHKKNNDIHVLKQLYTRVIQSMAAIQIDAAKDINWDLCYPRKAFDRQSIQWDLNYFKYMFLKVTGVLFDEQKLEDDFNALTNFLLEAPSGFFMYRDFQSRNIMIKDEELYFIDYQGGRRGSLQYDLASLLYEGKTSLSSQLRKELLDVYCATMNRYEEFDETKFRKYYPAFALVRLLQALGAYGYRGLVEKKQFFVESIPKGISNLKELFSTYNFDHELPHLTGLVHSLNTQSYHTESSDVLTVRILSFSYKKGIPEDYTGNGGGFVFDCRSLPNPGRLEEYKAQTGLDEPVIQFLEQNNEVEKFKQSAILMAENAVKNYVSRGFKHIQVSFGCTGGQHRSVYMAENLALHLSKIPSLHVMLTHREQQIEKFYE